MAGKKFKAVERGQMCLFPPSVSDWLPKEHLAYFILDVVDQLDLAEIYAS